MNKFPLLLAALLVTPALAHELVRDGNVGALLHILPDDNPVAGKPNAAWFDVNQRGGKPITLSDCACMLNVYAGAYQEGEEPLSTPKLRMDKDRLGANLEFPRESAYTLVLTGKPKGKATFNAFRLEWVVRAIGSGSPENHDGH